MQLPCKLLCFQVFSFLIFDKNKVLIILND
jgi:hypothetical protein